MPSKSVLTASLTPELSNFIAAKVKTGHYRSASEVVRAALRLMVEKDDHEEHSTRSERHVTMAQATNPVVQDRLVTFFQQAPGMIAVVSGPEHRYEFANASYLDLIGRRDVVGRKVRDVAPELEHQGTIALLDNVYSAGEPFVGRQMPIAFQRQPGAPPETRYIDFVYQPMMDSQGRVTGIFAHGIDVTEQIRSRTLLQESEERFRILTNLAPNFIWIADANGEVQFLNDRWYEYTGQTEEEALSFGWANALHPDDAAETQRIWADALGRRGEYEVETRYRRRDGAYRWYVTRAVPYCDPASGEVRAWLGTSTDIHDRKTAEQELRASESRLRLALDAGRMGVWESDSSTNSITTSPELNRLLGFSDDVPPTTDEIYSRYAPGARHRLQSAVAAALSRGERHMDEELEIIWPDGSHRWLLLRADLDATSEQNNRRVKATGIALDITGRKRWEEHQRLLIHELNHRVKNTLATVQSMAAQSFRHVSEEDQPKLRVFEERLFALSRAHDVLTRENWDKAELHAIIVEVLEPYLRASGQHFHIDGPRLHLTPSVALALAMALHELTTNALKYGALSSADGHVSITWKVTRDDGPFLWLRWEEQGGPPVVAPTRKGFGTRLIERTMANDISGEVRLNFEPTGVVCIIRAPLKQEDGEPLVERKQGVL
jgi:putative addiction module CopG family antidote